LLKSNELPSNVTDPAITQTPQGAVAAYNGTLGYFGKAFGGFGQSFVSSTGTLGDELTSAFNNADAIDLRNLPEGNSAGDGTYAALQGVRGRAAQALGLLAQYVPAQPVLRGRLYALEGYAEVMLAELFCSGIPLSTVDYHGDFTLRPGSTTAQVFTHAVALFDTALTLASDSARFTNLVRVGRGRALLALGEYAAAAEVVAPVPDDYRYVVTYASQPQTTSNFAFTNGSWSYKVPDREGVNGLDYRSSGDPRTQVDGSGHPNNTPPTARVRSCWRAGWRRG